MSARSFDGLPPLLAQIAGVAGIAAALKVAEAKGGQRVYIPPYARKGHWLWEAVGPDAAARICDHFRILDRDNRAIGGRHTPLVIPFGPHRGAAAEARRTFLEAIHQGESVREAAHRAGLHEISGFRIKRRAREAEARSAEARKTAPTLFDAGLKAPSNRGKRRAG